jgi:hypothetical protein
LILILRAVAGASKAIAARGFLQHVSFFAPAQLSG